MPPDTTGIPIVVVAGRYAARRPECVCPPPYSLMMRLSCVAQSSRPIRKPCVDGFSGVARPKAMTSSGGWCAWTTTGDSPSRASAPDGRGVGIARYEELRDSDTVEVAVAVAPAWRHVGLATAMVPLLAAAAVRNGLRCFTAEFFADNVDVTVLIAETKAPYQNSSASGVAVAEVTLPGGGPGGQ